jgi:hypothetical protein
MVMLGTLLTSSCSCSHQARLNTSGTLTSLLLQLLPLQQLGYDGNVPLERDVGIKALDCLQIDQFIDNQRKITHRVKAAKQVCHMHWC